MRLSFPHRLNYIYLKQEKFQRRSMETKIDELRQDVVSACRILSHQKLVEGFGHVSARIPNTEHFLLTPRISLALVTESQLLTLDLDGKVIDGHDPAPFEAPLHTAIMKANRNVSAI